jgi:hypothetical protein
VISNIIIFGGNPGEGSGGNGGGEEGAGEGSGDVIEETEIVTDDETVPVELLAVRL